MLGQTRPRRRGAGQLRTDRQEKQHRANQDEQAVKRQAYARHHSLLKSERHTVFDNRWGPVVDNSQINDATPRRLPRLSLAGVNLIANGAFRAPQTILRVPLIESATRSTSVLHSQMIIELAQQNYFHAVFEATKSVADKIRRRSGFVSDGATLVDEAFGTSSGVPALALNSLRTSTE